MISLDNYTYYIDYKLAKEQVGAYLDAELRLFQVVQGGKIIRELEIQGLVGHPMAFNDYVKHMLAEARTSTRRNNRDSPTKPHLIPPCT